MVDAGVEVVFSNNGETEHHYTLSLLFRRWLKRTISKPTQASHRCNVNTSLQVSFAKTFHFHFLPFPSSSIENERVAGKCIHEQPVTCQVSVYTNISSVGSIADKGVSNISRTRNTIFDTRRTYYPFHTHTKL